MKKLFALLLAVMLIASMAVAVSAESTTTLTTTVPAATYTLNIPADQEIPFGATETNIGNVTVTNSSGFAVGKNLKVVVTYDAFAYDGVSTTIPFALTAKNEKADASLNSVDIPSGNHLTFYGQDTTEVTIYAQEEYNFTGASSNRYSALANIDKLILSISEKTWGKALAGDYSATITFTAEVVVEE